MNQPGDLFTATGDANAPLAERLRPKAVDDMVGQRHLLGEGRPLWVALRAGKPHSMILWGPPGVGKTTLARLMAKAFNAELWKARARSRPWRAPAPGPLGRSAR